MELDAISPSTVHNALRAIRAARTLADSPLLQLRAVVEGLRAERVADSPSARSAFLQTWLEGIARDELAALRGSDETPGGRRSSAADAFTSLQKDFRANSVDREAWGALHFHYFSGTDVKLREVASALGLGYNTVRRRIERGYQLLAAQVLAKEQAASAAAAIGRTVPRPLTRFIGRERELGAIRAVMAEHRLVVLTGPGGIGKSRLAVRLAHDLAADYPDGATFIEMAAVADDRQVAQSVLRALGLREAPGRRIVDVLTAFLADKRMLLVIDNCEHVVGATSALIGELLLHTPGLQVLATSREELRVAGGYAWTVPPMGLPPEGVVVAAAGLMHFDATRLFGARSAMASPGNPPTDADAAQVARICARLDGIPLAIELAAARTRQLSLDQLEARLANRFTVLKDGRHVTRPGHETLWSAMEWSFDLLTDAEQKLLARLSVFRGGWTLEAAESVGAGDGVADGDVLALLTQLDAKSLVHRRDAGGAPRFHMLETVRQFAAEKCAHDPETERAAIRHMLYFATMADSERLAQASPSSAAWRSRLASELDNLQRALHVATSTGSLEPALRLGIVLAKIWELHGTFAPVSALLLPLLDTTPSPGLQSLRIGLQVAVADVVLQAGDLDAALPLAQAALDAAVRIGDKRVLADAQLVIAQRALWTGEFEAAGDLYEASRRLCLELDDVLGAAAAMRGLGQLAIMRGDLASAAAQFQESLELARSARDPYATAAALNGLGATHLAMSDHVAARAAFEEALAIFRQLGLPGRVSVTLHNLANVSASTGDSEGAMTYARESLALARNLDDKIGVADTLMLLGNLEVAHDDVPAGLAKQVESLAIMRAIGYQRSLPVLLLNLSDAEERLDHLDAARGYAQECVALCTEAGISELGGALGNLSRIAAREGDEAQARRHFSAAVMALRQQEGVMTLVQVFETRASSPPFASQTSLKLRLSGAAAAMREAIGERRGLRDEARLQSLFDAAGQDLGPAETVRLLEEGRALTREEAVAYALEELSWDDLWGVVAERLATSALAAGASGWSQG